ncbi:hypothetical protein MRX96_007207 [Rhipicephalus microplus]
MNISVGYPWWIRDHLRGSTALITCSCSGIKRRPVSPSVTLQQQLRLYVSASILKAFGRFRRNQVCCWTTVATDSVVLCYQPFELFDACFTTLLSHLCSCILHEYQRRLSLVDKGSSAWIYCADHLLVFRHKAEARLTQRHFAAAVTALRIGIYSKGFWTIPKKSSVLLDDGCHGFGGPVLPTISAFRRLLHHLTESICVRAFYMNISVGYPWWIRDHLRGSTALITCSCSGIKRRPVSRSVTLQQQLRLYVSASILKVFQRFRRLLDDSEEIKCAVGRRLPRIRWSCATNHFSFLTPASPPD